MTDDRRTFLAANDFALIPMRAGTQSIAALLKDALPAGVLVEKDPKREGFYWTTLAGRRVYLHAHEARKRIYVLADAPIAPNPPAPAEGDQPAPHPADCSPVA